MYLYVFLPSSVYLYVFLPSSVVLVSTVGERNTKVYTLCVGVGCSATNKYSATNCRNVFLQIWCHIEFLDNSNSNWGRQTAVF